ncbi:hypothetical protein evm_011707 [Chilo suppressalis]|nr:hypothetical protein evm_011707 [Chilo suppressalis]
MFTKSSNNKVKFQDQQLDDYLLENSVLKSKLQSKIDALLIMSKELDKSSMERDRYKVLVEQLKYKKPTILNQNTSSSIYKFTPTNTVSSGDMLAKTRDQNNTLKLEVETLRSKLEEATGDIVALRKQLQRKTFTCENNPESRESTLGYSNKNFEESIEELEKIQKKYQQIQLDYRATLDEKEELISDRDYYKNKVQRLNQQISYILTNRIKLQSDKEIDPPKPIVDIDALVTENKYLHERITQLQVEKEIIKRTLTKYKTLLDNRNSNEAMNLKKGFMDVMTQKQVREFLDVNSKTGFKRSSAPELKSVCLGLFEALNDKSIALQHQRKTNQILANRITELEKTLESWCNGQKYIPVFPSQILLEEFLPDMGSIKSDETKEKDSRSYKENLKNEFDSEDDIINKDDSNGDVERSYDDDGDFQSCVTKTVLPLELEELVKEALAEMKSKYRQVRVAGLADTAAPDSAVYAARRQPRTRRRGTTPAHGQQRSTTPTLPPTAARVEPRANRPVFVPESGTSDIGIPVTVTDRIVDAIRSINSVRSNQHFYISNFDPKLHNIDDWCEEVERAKCLNNWNDYECLSRIGNCLKGDAQTWGLGSQEIESTSYVTLPIEFDGITMEVDLFVVSSEFMNTPIIVGTDVLNREGVQYVRTRDYQLLSRKLMRSNEVMTIQSDLNIPIKTNLIDRQLQQLLAIISEFSEYFISGTATSTVNTGSMSIKLSSNTPIHYRPYRLSLAEILRVRDIVNDLLIKGIIRESISDYASPILLVKKKDGSDRMCVDYRKLNEVTVKDRFPFSRVNKDIKQAKLGNPVEQLRF